MTTKTKPRTFTVHGVPEKCPNPDCDVVMPRSAYAVAQLAMGNALAYVCPNAFCKAKVKLVR